MIDRRTLQLLMIGFGTVVVPLDSSVNIAFPAIAAGFGLAIQDIQWVVICYLLTYVSLLLALGRIGDLFGHALVFRVGLVWSAAALLLSALAPTYPLLLACRFLQGIGAALVLSCGPALATSLFGEDRRTGVLGVYTMCWALGMALGPLVGGVLVQAWGWPAVFWFRVPVALAPLLLLRSQPAAGPARREPFDLAGAALLALGLVAMLLAFNRSRELTAVPLALLAVGALAGFIRQELRAPRPMLDLRVFRLPGFALLNIVYVLTNLAAFSVWLLVPFYFTRTTDLTLAESGTVLAAGSFAMTIAAYAGGRLIGGVGGTWPMLCGIVLVSAGLFLVGTWGQGTAVWQMIAALALQGLGLGLMQIAYTDTVTATIPRQDRGVAGSLAMLVRTIGTVSAAALVLLLFQALQVSDGFLPAFQRSFQCVGALAVLMAALLLVRRRVR